MQRPGFHQTTVEVPGERRRGPRRIAFVHPSLGLGGAERLVLDAALALKDAGHEVRLFTPDFDPDHCFEEARNGRLDVRVHGASLPASIGGRVRVPCVLARSAVAAAAAMRWAPDLVFCDTVAHVLPLLRFGPAPVLFYGHFPDLLLTARDRRWYRWYRVPLDELERRGTALAHRLVVNSHFTAGVFTDVFPGLRPVVLHPGVQVPAEINTIPDGPEIVLASINRFDPKKNLPLAVEAFAALRSRLEPPLFARARLVLAGGLDRRMQEQREEFDKLRRLADILGVAEQVELRPSIDEAERDALLASSRALLYTPEREHFGIVPLEAMAAGRPVVAARSGGPLETILHGETGFLCEANAGSFADALAILVSDVARARQMGANGREHVLTNFSGAVFARDLDAIVREMTGG